MRSRTRGRSGGGGLERPAALLGLQRARELVELALQDPVELVHGQLDPVVRQPVLREVVGPDLLRPLPGPDLRVALYRERGLLPLPLELVRPRAQDAERLRLVLELRLLVLHGDDD